MGIIETITTKANALPNTEIMLILSAMPGREKGRREYLCEAILQATYENQLKWLTFSDSNILIGIEKKEVPSHIIIIRCTKHNYRLSIVHIGAWDTILDLEDNHDQSTYRAFGYIKPIMDLYDVLMTGKKRPIEIEHVCGLQGFGMDTSDRCPACEKQS